MQTFGADDPRPAYLQLADKIRSEIDSGARPPGDQLPTHRELADQHGVAVETVKRALGLLRTSGHIVSRQGKGSFVSERAEDGPAVLSQNGDVAELLASVKAELSQVRRRLDVIETRLDGLGSGTDAR
ncbi:GntR family transcriptional regulator [Amycolatopsis sp. YIM 10]|uniref:GntR family transcriptional regulator n=1 Tax=Amycolatopsis sp. YIM 10 TaxID=2653857 RepID=UPI00128FF577|nr:GntR family transcriptional regulator [Amycolatopsis sp. YIM 10]QFU90959.1 Arabinose metabolism transcriptional repressor [Amycolatopsis sp. YIM 10]